MEFNLAFKGLRKLRIMFKCLKSRNSHFVVLSCRHFVEYHFRPQGRWRVIPKAISAAGRLI